MIIVFHTFLGTRIRPKKKGPNANNQQQNDTKTEETTTVSCNEFLG